MAGTATDYTREFVCFV